MRAHPKGVWISWRAAIRLSLRRLVPFSNSFFRWPKRSSFQPWLVAHLISSSLVIIANPFITSGARRSKRKVREKDRAVGEHPCLREASRSQPHGCGESRQTGPDSHGRRQDRRRTGGS